MYRTDINKDLLIRQCNYLSRTAEQLASGNADVPFGEFSRTHKEFKRLLLKKFSGVAAVTFLISQLPDLSVPLEKDNTSWWDGAELFVDVGDGLLLLLIVVVPIVVFLIWRHYRRKGAEEFKLMEAARLYGEIKRHLLRTG